MVVVAVDGRAPRPSRSAASGSCAPRARPDVAISTPRPNATVSGRRAFTAQVAADKGIRRVEFLVHGKRRWTQKSPPWRFGGKDGLWNTGKYAVGRHRLTVTAIDNAGHRRSSTRTVTVARSGSGAAGAPAPSGGAPSLARPRTPPAPPLPPATRFVLTSGSDATACTAAAPCASLGRAYQVASPGEVVEAAGGAYGNQRIDAQASKTSPTDVYFRPAPSAGVSVSYIEVYGSHVEIRSLTTRGWYVRPGANDVTLRDVTSVGGGTFITSANDVNILGGTIANADSVDGLQVKMSAVDPHVEPTNLLIDGLFIHDVTRVAEPSAHTECIQFTAGRNVVIRNSWFTDCSTQGVFFKEGLGGEIDNVLVENSWFGKLIGYNTLIFDDGVSNMVARYNSFAQAPRLGGGVSTSNLSAYCNAGIMSNGCGEGVAYRYNVWSASRCSSTDLQANPSFVNPGALDLRLAANSPRSIAATRAHFPRPMSSEPPGPSAGARTQERTSGSEAPAVGRSA